MNADQQENIPKVFISYSHDSPPHKAWVAELATKLRENGIDVRLDRWDLRRGEDVPKFMERSVNWADRVLMICTNSYVRKADEGKGGVGYEAMIVTSELIKDLGTAKFIPVIRQDSGKSEVPKFMGTRFYVNLSEEKNFDEEFGELLRELHNEPALKKPPIGKNPFAKTPSGTEVLKVASGLPESTAFSEQSSLIVPEPSYQNALDVARTGDILVWRRLVQKSKNLIPEKLAGWRDRWEKAGVKSDEVVTMCSEGIQAYEPLVAVALAGVESGRDTMKHQIGVIDDLLSPKGWNRAGLVVIVDFPYAAGFTYQALHGAVCLETQQLDLALTLAKTRVSDPNNFQRQAPLYCQRRLIGWPSSLLSNANAAWSYLRELPKALPWLNDVFADKENFETAVCAYYLALNTIELAGLIADKDEGLLEKDSFNFKVPLYALNVPHEQSRRAYALLMRDPKQLRHAWEDFDVSESRMYELWPRWIQHVNSVMDRISRFDFEGMIPHQTLFEDLPKKRD